MIEFSIINFTLAKCSIKIYDLYIAQMNDLFND